jgi:hypothetical protein
MSQLRFALLAALTISYSAGAFAQETAAPLSLDNFARAESDGYIANIVKEGGLGKFSHNREPASIDNQTVIRLNRDTLYSFGVFDLDAGPVMIAMPDAGKRFMSLQVINEDHYVPAVYYGAGPHTLTKESVGTRYVVAGVRTLVDPNDSKDLDQVHRLQDAIKVSQKEAGTLNLPNWNQAARKDIHEALLVLAKYAGVFSHSFGRKGEVDPLRHMIGTAAGWGGNPDKDATYMSTAPATNDGVTIYKLHVKDVPVDAFWPVSLYNAAGYYEKIPAMPIR